MSNLRERQESIPESTLPQVFRDAFIIARRLNIRYIWIDALCIVQDDPEDWLRESVLMSQVYENCTLTISATKSNKCENGFLQPRDNLEQEIGTYLDPNERPLYVRVAQSNVHQIQGPLNDRGWTFQERLLSPAVLHFTEDGIYWECRSICVNDSGARLHCNVELKAMYALEEWSFGGGEEYESASGFEIFWAGIVENYCKRALIFPQDKLLALSGIAQRYQVRTDGKYVARLWENKLMKWLLWQRSKTAAWGLQVFGQRSSIYRAPSWSWASLDGSFKYDRFIFEQDPVPCPSLAFQIQSCFIQEESPGACGTISYSHLTITGLLYEAKYTIIRQSIYQEELHTEIGIWRCMMNAPIYPKDYIERKGYCWIIPIAIWREGNWAGLRHLRLWGLVLGRPRDVFQPLHGDLMRLGIATMSLPLDYYRLPDGADYTTEESSAGDTLNQSNTFSGHFSDNEKQPEEHKIDEEPSSFYSGMNEEKKIQWEERMSELQFNKSMIRTVRVV
ncbi:hypothetical protein IFR05_001263 [Cadophora sp. M221]|nr:hypothetical protein IFR05_001263 [Cadophora sp. M221]